MKPSERLKKYNTIENLWIYILSLAKKGPVYGYKLRKSIFENFGFQPGRITSYRVLYRLENEKFIKSIQKGRRRIYTITQKGKEELKKARQIFEDILKKI